MDDRYISIVEKGLSRGTCTESDCRYLLELDPDSEETDHLISSADSFVRKACDNCAEIGVQIGVITGPCYADCGFCSFAYSITDQEQYTMDADTLRRYLKHITMDNLVTTVSLMTIHNFDFDDFLDIVEVARSALPENISIASNTGDLDGGECRELKKAGVSSAYHAIRIGESIDNQLELRERYHTIKNLRDAGIKVATGVEPIGPEHSVKDICDAYFESIRIGCDSCSASMRESVTGTRLFGSGSISSRRLLQIRSALLMCSTHYDHTEFGHYGGFYGGFNKLFAEYAGSPKDLEWNSEEGLGRTLEWAVRTLREQGYPAVRGSDGIHRL